MTAVKFLPSFTSTCNEPFDDEFRDVGEDFMLPNLRKFNVPALLPPPLLFELCDDDDDESGGMNFKPTIISPL